MIVLIPTERDGSHASLGVSGNHTEPEGSCGVLQDGRGGRERWRSRGDLWLWRCITSGKNHFSLRYCFRFNELLAIVHINLILPVLVTSNVGLRRIYHLWLFFPGYLGAWITFSFSFLTFCTDPNYERRRVEKLNILTSFCVESFNHNEDNLYP